jgi:hypothetical protein
VIAQPRGVLTLATAARRYRVAFFAALRALPAAWFALPLTASPAPLASVEDLLRSVSDRGIRVSEVLTERRSLTRMASYAATRSRPGFSLLAVVYLVAGGIVAATHHYWSNLHSLKAIASAVLATILWPLVLIGINLHIH